MDSAISSDIQFADDRKIGRLIRTASNAIALQEDMDWMNKWTDGWQM